MRKRKPTEDDCTCALLVSCEFHYPTPPKQPPTSNKYERLGENVTQEELKNVLSYDPETGDFVWLISPASHVKIGRLAGRIGANGYRVIKYNRRDYGSHRLAWLYMTGEFPQNQIDHIDGDPLNNRIVNLRDVDRTQNQRNRRRNRNNKSGITGVSWHKSLGQWQSDTKDNGATIHLGCFKDFFEACCARKSANNRYGFHPNHGRPQ